MLVAVGIALFIYAALFWALTTGIALGIGRILKKSDAVRKGPTGVLAAMNGPAPLT
jgi:hypothetical protein